MEFEVYCDENYPDLFTSNKPKARFMMIGSLWIPAVLREEAKLRIQEVRERHRVWGEIKWRKVSPAKLQFYKDLADVFFSFGSDMRFRCIAIDRIAYDATMNNGDNELGFYKFYYQLLHHWILDNNEYDFFCDTKTNRRRNRLGVLRQCLAYTNRTSRIDNIQALPSKEVVLIQLCDLLLGAASSRINDTLVSDSAKEALARHIETRLNRFRLTPTSRCENKFNIFKINLQGGW